MRTKARRKISPKVRFAVLTRDNFTCVYCGAHGPDVILQIDHTHPVALGGDNEITNLATACQVCNAGKSDTPLLHAPPTPHEIAVALTVRDVLHRKFPLNQSEYDGVAQYIIDAQREFGFTGKVLWAIAMTLETVLTDFPLVLIKLMEEYQESLRSGIAPRHPTLMPRPRTGTCRQSARVE